MTIISTATRAAADAYKAAKKSCEQAETRAWLADGDVAGAYYHGYGEEAADAEQAAAYAAWREAQRTLESTPVVILPPEPVRRLFPRVAVA